MSQGKTLRTRNYRVKEMDKELYTAKELSELLSVSIGTIWRWGREGKLIRVKVGRTIRFRKPRGEKKR